MITTRRITRAALWWATIAIATGLGPARASDLIWQVENPFRFYKHASSFELHEDAFKAAGGETGSPPPAGIIARMERHLNDPYCRDASTPAACENTIIGLAKFQERRLGWAARTLNDVCYERTHAPRHVETNCRREGRPAGESYILPTGHTVSIALAPQRLEQARDGQCSWTWQARAGGAPGVPVHKPCRDGLVISDVPYVANDDAHSGISVDVELPDGTHVVEPDLFVKDLLVVALGDSFASGEGNPDRPVTFSATREIIYDERQYTCGQVAAARGHRRPAPIQEYAHDDWHVLPRRRLAGDESGVPQPCETSPQFRALYDKYAAEWLSADCHRSQYGYPFRVALELALENRHRAVTFVPLTCSGAETVAGLFKERKPREQSGRTMVRAQLAELTDLLCDRGAAPMRSVEYPLPTAKVRNDGLSEVTVESVRMHWCPKERRKRDVDLLMLSLGGNDIGFSALAAYTILDNVGDIGRIATLFDHELRFGPDRAEKYLKVLDRRMEQVKKALHDGFGIEPGRVIQTAYEPLQFDENGELCGDPSLDMNVHPKFRLDRERLRRAAHFFDELSSRLQCMARHQAGCPALATGEGTGFTLVTAQVQDFARRGLCARDPADGDGRMMAMPRRGPKGEAFRPYSPAYFTPYAHHTRLFRTPNDAFLTANTHAESILLVDIIQPAFAALYSGAFHPTAEAHTIIADRVMCPARAVVEGRDPAACEGTAPSALK